MATRLQIRIALLAVATLAILASFAFAAANSDAKPRDAVQMRTFARGATASATKLSVVAQSPANGATVAGAIAWEVKASSSRVYRVDFAVDGAAKSSDSRAPFAYAAAASTRPSSPTAATPSPPPPTRRARGRQARP